jgi:NitT/TauT family transport system substrate-binding protein
VQRTWTRADALRGIAAAGIALPLTGAGPAGKPEVGTVRVGIAVESTSYLPLYIAAARTWKLQGIDVQLLAFRGDAEVSQALAGGSVDIACGSTNGLINLVKAQPDIIGFYAGYHLAGFSWYAAPGIRTWADVKGKASGVSTFGSMTDALTRYLLLRHGLQPEKDVQLLQVGGSASQLEALRAGRTAVAMLSAPVTWQAQAAGFTLIATQSKDIAPEWPEHIFSAKRSFLTQAPQSTIAVLRGFVTAIRLARADRAYAAGVLDRLKYTPDYANRAYDEVIRTFDERGSLPERSMPTFWEILVRNGDVTAPLPEATFLDRRFIATYSSWAPTA